MSSKMRIFFAGVGTTFVILAVGFGGGLIMAKSALKEPTGYQARANTESIAPVRVILPASAEAARPPQPSAAAVATPEPQVQPSVKEVQAPVEKQVEKADARKAEAEDRKRHRRYAEHKARKIAAARARQQQEPQTRERSEPGIMAFGGEPRFGGGFLGN